MREVMEKGFIRNWKYHVLIKDGTTIPVEMSVAAIKDVEGNPIGFVGVNRDITERERAEETIRHLAYHDSLTGLPNRTLFRDRLTQALKQRRNNNHKAAIMFLDLDNFKVVNDTVGHTEGDNLLKQVAEQLLRVVREGDTVARVGGDEFTILLPNINRVEDAVFIAERILQNLRHPRKLAGHEFIVTASIGLTVSPDDGVGADTLLSNADTAMYRAKEQGRNQYQLYTASMNTRIAERLALETSMRHGLERGEFVVHYQPQVDVQTLEIVGIEALVRWQHPERGLVSPDDFIPVAEETGLIIPLGEHVLRTACSQAKAWQDAGLPPLRVAVNLSVRQFQQRNLIDTVATALRQTGLDPRYLQLEMTEGVAMKDAKFTAGVLQKLRDMSVQIAIDDFGTGYSSLSYLKGLPVDTIKIDQTFVQDLTTDPNDAAIASSIIAMAHNLKLKVIAEGVETKEQLAFLREQGCDEFQGYLFSRPVTAEALEKILKAKWRLAQAKR